MKKFKPKNEWILVKPTENQKTFGTSFHVSDDNRHKPTTGEVIDVGPGRHGKGLDVEIGDDMMYQANGSVPITVEEENLLLVHSNQVLGSWKPTEIPSILDVAFFLNFDRSNDFLIVSPL